MLSVDTNPKQFFDAFFAQSDGRRFFSPRIAIRQALCRMTARYLSEQIRGAIQRRRSAVRVDASPGFELCPAAACQIEQPSEACPAVAPGDKFQIVPCFEHPLIPAWQSFLAANDIGVAGIEFIAAVHRSVQDVMNSLILDTVPSDVTIDYYDDTEWNDIRSDWITQQKLSVFFETGKSALPPARAGEIRAFAAKVAADIRAN